MHKQARHIFAALCLVMVAGCTKTDTGAGPPGSVGANGEKNRTTIPHVLRIGDNQDITTLNPHLGTAVSLGNLSQMTMGYLVRYGKDNRPIPELATEVPTKKNGLISKDGLRITWHLRKGVKWSDGQPFNGDDVVFSTNVVNNTANNEVGRDGWDLITKMDQPDKFTVVFHLRKPYSGFLPTFFGSAGANPCVLPKHILGKLANINNAAYNSKPVGIGPFRYVTWIRNDHVELEPNPYYWRGTPKLQKIVYRFIPDRNTLLTQLQTGEIDMWPLVGNGYYTRVQAVKTATTTHRPGYLYQHLDFNNSHPIFADKAVRLALRYAIDRQTIIDKLQHGLGAVQEGAITPVSPLYAPIGKVPFDIAKANALLDAAGWQRGPDGIRAKNGQKLTFAFSTTAGTPDVDQQIELMRSNWAQIGASISVRPYAPAVFFAPFQQGGTIYAGKFDIITFAWQQTPDGDLSNIYDSTQVPPNGQNDLHYKSAKVDALLQKSRAAYDEEERKPILIAIQKQVMEDVPQIILWVREDIFSYNNDLKNYDPNNTTFFDNMLSVDI